jgi:hypothetical protein
MGRARRPRRARLRSGTPLRVEVLPAELARQIAQALRQEYPGEAGWAVSLETIYPVIYVQAGSACGKSRLTVPSPYERARMIVFPCAARSG